MLLDYSSILDMNCILNSMNGCAGLLDQGTLNWMAHQMNDPYHVGTETFDFGIKVSSLNYTNFLTRDNVNAGVSDATGR